MPPALRPLLLPLALLSCPAPAEPAPAEGVAPPPEAVALDPAYATAAIEPVSTSIYIGSVRLRMPPFERRDGRYESTYSARVRPLFFYNEHGRLHIELADEDLRRLAAGERVHFTGEAENHEGAPRRIEGHADPADAHSGRIKVRVFVTEKIQLIFNTTYRFTGVD